MNTPKFEALSASEIAWIHEQLDSLKAIVSVRSPSDSWYPLRAEALDRAWDSWLDSKPEDEAEINRHINAFGVAFGQLLVDSDVFSWVIVTDDYGTDLGIRGLPNRGDVSIVPASFVAKRWERRECSFFCHAIASIYDHVESLRKDWEREEDK